MMEIENIEIEMIQGPFNSISTQVFVRANVEGNPDGQSAWQAGWRIVGQITGPYCVHSETLAAVIAFQDQGDGAGCNWRGNRPQSHACLRRLRTEKEERRDRRRGDWVGSRPTHPCCRCRETPHLQRAPRRQRSCHSYSPQEPPNPTKKKTERADPLESLLGQGPEKNPYSRK